MGLWAYWLIGRTCAVTCEAINGLSAIGDVYAVGISVIATSHGGGRGRGDIEFAAGVFEYAIVFFRVVINGVATDIKGCIANACYAVAVWLCSFAA